MPLVWEEMKVFAERLQSDEMQQVIAARMMGKK